MGGRVVAVYDFFGHFDFPPVRRKSSTTAPGIDRNSLAGKILVGLSIKGTKV
jgi:hypothetical protein